MRGELVSLLFLRSKQRRADLQAFTDVQHTHANRLALGNYTPGRDPEHVVPNGSGQVLALDVASREPGPSFFFENLSPLPRG